MEQIYYSFVPNSLGSRCVGFGEVINLGFGPFVDQWVVKLHGCYPALEESPQNGSQLAVCSM